MKIRFGLVVLLALGCSKPPGGAASGSGSSGGSHAASTNASSNSSSGSTSSSPASSTGSVSSGASSSASSAGSGSSGASSGGSTASTTTSASASTSSGSTSSTGASASTGTDTSSSTGGTTGPGSTGTTSTASSTSGASNASGSTGSTGLVTTGATSGGSTGASGSTGAGSTTGSTGSTGTTGQLPHSTVEGTWFSNFARIELRQQDTAVIGWVYPYGYGGAQNFASRIQGYLDGTTLIGRIYAFDGSRQTASLTFDANHNTFDGSFYSSGVKHWCGTRALDDDSQPTELPAGCGFAGHWNINVDGAVGTAELTQTGAVVGGSYTLASEQGTIALGVADWRGNGTWSPLAGSGGRVSLWFADLNDLAFQGNRLTSAAWCGWRDGQTAPTPCLGGGDLFDGDWSTPAAEYSIRQALGQTSVTVLRLGWGRQLMAGFPGTASGIQLNGSDPNYPFDFRTSASNPQLGGTGLFGEAGCGVLVGPLPPNCGFSSDWSFFEGGNLTSLITLVQERDRVTSAPGGSHEIVGTIAEHTARGTDFPSHLPFTWVLPTQTDAIQGHYVAGGTPVPWCARRGGVTQAPATCADAAPQVDSVATLSGGTLVRQGTTFTLALSGSNLGSSLELELDGQSGTPVGTATQAHAEYSFTLLHGGTIGPRDLAVFSNQGDQRVLSPIQVSPISVSPQGSDANDGTVSSPFAHVSNAISNALEGDVIYIRPGTYTASQGESFPLVNGLCSIPDGVALLGDVDPLGPPGAQWVTLEDDLQSNSSVGLAPCGDAILTNVHLSRLVDGLMAAHPGIVFAPGLSASYCRDNGVALLGGSQVTMLPSGTSECAVRVSTSDGVEVDQNSSLTLEGCSVEQNGHMGVYVGGGSSLSILGGQVRGNAWAGIHLENAGPASLTGDAQGNPLLIEGNGASGPALGLKEGLGLMDQVAAVAVNNVTIRNQPNGDGLFTGNNPGSTVTGGSLVVGSLTSTGNYNGLSYTQQGGQLRLRSSTLTGNLASGVYLGGQLAGEDLGTAASPGGNVLAGNHLDPSIGLATNLFVDLAQSPTVSAVGNYWDAPTSSGSFPDAATGPDGVHGVIAYPYASYIDATGLTTGPSPAPPPVLNTALLDGLIQF